MVKMRLPTANSSAAISCSTVLKEVSAATCSLTLLILSVSFRASMVTTTLAMALSIAKSVRMEATEADFLLPHLM